MSFKHVSGGSPNQWSPSSNLSMQEPQFYEKTVTYINCIHSLVAIATREGLVVYPEYSQADLGPYFIIRHQYKFRPSIKDQIVRDWKEGRYHDTDFQIIIQEQWINNPTAFYSNVLFLEYKIHESQITQNGGIVYLPVADCTVAVGDRAKDSRQIYHPYSASGTIIEAARDSLSGSIREEEHSNDYSYHIRIVDNTGTIGTKWISIGSFISKIIPVKRPKQRDGFYVTRTCNTDHLHTGPNTIVCDWYETADEVPNYVISDTYAQATQSPSVEASIKEKISINERTARLAESEFRNKKLESELEILNNTISREEIRHQNDMAKLNAEIEKLKREKEKYESEKEFLNEKVVYEKSSLWRKFIGETIKYVPIIVTTTVTIWKLFIAKKG